MFTKLFINKSTDLITFTIILTTNFGHGCQERNIFETAFPHHYSFDQSFSTILSLNKSSLTTVDILITTISSRSIGLLMSTASDGKEESSSLRKRCLP